MVNYNQQFKDQVIVAIHNSNDYNYFDSSLTSNNVLYAVGQKTSNNFDQLKSVSQLSLWTVKQDTILNLSVGGSVRVHDDDGNLGYISLNGYADSQKTSFASRLSQPLSFNTRDNNVRFDDFAPSAGMTKNIADLSNTSNVGTFTATITIPDDVKCNYSSGTHKFIKTESVNFLLDGNLQKDDTLTVKRTGRQDLTTTLNYDTDLAFTNLSVNDQTNLELIYKHKNEPAKPTTATFTSSDPGIQWQNDSMQDSGTSFQNTVIVQKGYALKNKLKVNYTDKTGQPGVLTFTDDSYNTFDGDSSNNKWILTINSGYTSLSIPANQATYKQYELIPTLQNAELNIPKGVVDDYDKTHYYLDPKNTTITIKANEGYTFNDNGSLSYQRSNEQTVSNITIPASNTDTVAFNLPADFDWSNLNTFQTFKLTIGATKAEIVKTAGGFTNIYKADYTNLLKFSNEVIVKSTGSGSLQPYDFTQYIHNLIMLPFKIPATSESAIIAGNETFTTKFPTIDNPYLKVDLGKITVNEQYKNAYDYYQVKTRLMLPFTDMIELDPKHVINQTVSITYNVNVINGDTTINVSNDDDIFYSNQVNLASEIPFITTIQKGSQYSVINRLKTVFRNSIRQAYIIIEQPTPILNSDFYPTREIGKVTNYQGRLKASLLDDSGIDDSIDFVELQNLLSQGVIYNA